MSALNVTQAEADVLVSALSMFAKVHENASGVVPDEVAVLLAKLAPKPVTEEAPVEAVEVSEETLVSKSRKSKATSEDE